METLFDYLPGTVLALEPLDEDAARERIKQTTDYYEARKEALSEGVTPLYKPLPPDRLYVTARRMGGAAEGVEARAHQSLRGAGGARTSSRSARAPGRNFAAERAEPNANVFEAVAAHVHVAAGRRQARRHRAVERGRARAHEPRARRPQAA